MVEDLQIINANCFQYDLSFEMQNIPFDEKQEPNFDVINKSRFSLCLIKGMCHSGRTFFKNYLTDHFVRWQLRSASMRFSERCCNNTIIQCQYNTWALETSH
jgi:hypothetical protein